MQVTPEQITEATSKGLPITCATCKHMWADQGLKENCGKQATCGGPTSGRAFPDYDGPISRANFASCCLLCFRPEPTFLVVVGETKFGLCDEHYHVFDHVKREEGLTHPVQVIQLPHAKPKKPKLRVEFGG